MAAGSTSARYDAFARALRAGGIVSDPWVDGAPRFALEPLVVPRGRAEALARVGEEAVELWHEAATLVSEDPALLDDFFALTPAQKSMWLASEPLWHGLARADVFFTAEGPVVCELNCDTPTGEAEATELGRLAAATAAEAGVAAFDPNEALLDRLLAMIAFLAEVALGTPDHPRTLGLVYPTEFTEDLSLVRLYKAALEAAGWTVVLGSPYNLVRGDDGRVRLFDVPLAVVLRHYKTDWWGERVSAWTDEDIEDAAPLEAPLATVLRAQLEGKLAVVNPMGAVLPQNKRMMAFMWEHLHRFSTRGQTLVERLVPPTRRLEVVHEEQLFVQQAEWVLKSDYGAEGDEIVMGHLVPADAWRSAVLSARPGRWVAQRRFAPELDAEGHETNYGVYVVGGEAAGLYVRRSKGPTDGTALSVPVLVEA